ncbi:hypothetical protein C2G38_2217817 [Gigaspora rosea]|uniref:Uncharacterized protein n=1 Tax=Gigaspora rosea TaxID=44941 RepID=A0A397UG92_9GLOM|nr:hypothetical protein C2G38_2217817 [Gigaspora rosea]
MDSLELAIASEIRIEQKGVSNEQEKPKTIWDFFHLESGWALKSKQKYGKKETGKQGNVDKSKRFTAASMLECLKSKVEEGELDEDEIPKLQTIQSWIACYSAQHRQKMAEKSIEISSNNYPELDK